MERCRFVDEGAANWELPLPGLSEGHRPAGSDTLSPGPADVMCSGIPAEAGGALEADLSALSLYPAASCDRAEPPEHELVLPAAEDGQRRRGCPGTSPPACGCCGKAFGSASALSEHRVAHGQRNQHVRPVCSEALQRHDHPSGHLLMHQARKPFSCSEQGCDLRSLRQHCEPPHSPGVSRRPPDRDTGEAPLPYGGQPMAGPAAPPEPPPDVFLPWGSFVKPPPAAEQVPVDSAGGWGGLKVGEGALQEHLCQRSAAPPDACPKANPVAAPGKAVKAEDEAVSGEPAPGRPEDSFLPAQSRATCLLESLPHPLATPQRLPPPAGKRPAVEPLRAVFQQLPRLAPQPAADREPRARLQEPSSDGARRGPPASRQRLDLPGGTARPWRLPGARKQLVLGAASPSQVAMASFSSPGPAPPAPAGEKRRLTIFNRIQGGNIYRLGAALEDGGRAAGRTKSGAVPADSSGCESVFLCETCSQLFGAAKGLESHLCWRAERWRSPQGKEEQQKSSLGVAGMVQTPAAGDGSGPSEPAPPPLVIPVSVPVPAASQAPRRESAAARELPGGGSQHTRKRRRRRPLPQPLLIPPPPPEAQLGLGGCYQSNLRSPVLLVDHLLRDLVQRSPYTPPPMLSPIREGSGLYFSTVCSPSAPGDPRQLLSAVLERMDRDFGLCLVTDSTRISIEPHINVGSRFQAEIPALQQRPRSGGEEQAASLVWKPWGDIATNRETQERVTALLNMACSSVMPGGGTNLELALHCLHEARGSVLEALEMLLFGGPRKPESHPLANYRYAGSDSWTPAERQLFKKAFCVHKKDFYLIQKKIQTKNVSQCVEYYYTWKKKIKFDHGRAPVIEKKAKRDKNEVEEAEEKIAGSPRKRHCLLPKQRSCRKMPPSAGAPGEPPRPSGHAEDQNMFPCRECERVFDKIKGRNAHMKRHRPPAEPLLRTPWPLQHLQGQARPDEGQVPPAAAATWEAVLAE